mmetsp:Transcript_22631/g.45193  ORF Transcript_22631/g.45193 Transcript_22631/m.45193 type:complete len:210 (-) Transcript_22631:858-1487(-)
METLIIFSLSSALSLTNLILSKSMFAPLVMATRVFPSIPWLSVYFFIPATPSAPAGSSTTLASLYASLMAAHIWSVVTVTMSSTRVLQTLNVSLPTVLTAAPSANSPTLSRVTTEPARREEVMPAASSASTPMTLTSGLTLLTYAAIPASMPPPPQQTNTASMGVDTDCFRISMPIVPWPAMTSGSSKGWIIVRPSSSISLLASAAASS